MSDSQPKATWSASCLIPFQDNANISMALRFFALKYAALYCSLYTAPRLSLWRASGRAVVAAR